MLKFLKQKAADESGAVTVDWVVLTAGVVGLALGTIYIMNQGPVNIGTALANRLANEVPLD